MSLKRYLEGLKKRKEEGAVLVTAIILLTLMEILGFALVTMSEVESSIAANLARNEEAYYSAEQGVYMGINWIAENPYALSVGGAPQVINSSLVQGKSSSYTWGQDAWPYLRWETTIANIGYAPYQPGRRTDYDTYWYRIESVGQSTGRITRRIRVEFALSPELAEAVRTQQEEYRIQTQTGITTLKGKLAVFKK